nr:hypothetical protein [Tanacetum cinerariifolium]
MRRASMGYTGVDILLFLTMLVQSPILQGEGSTVPVESHHIPLDEAASIGVDVRHAGAATTIYSLDAGQGSGNINKTPSMPYNLPLLRVHTLGSDEVRMQQNELMDLVTKLIDRVLSLETYLQQTMKVYSTAFTKLIMKVNKLEKIVKSTKARRRAKIVVSDDEDAAEDSSKQGRKVDEIDQDPDISLVQHDVEDLVKERFSTTEPTYDKEKELWVELKRLFEPDNDDTLWKLQRISIDKRDYDFNVGEQAVSRTIFRDGK